VIVFTDVRNRARPGWLDALVAPLADESIAIVGGDVEIGGDQRLAHRLARRESHLDPRPLLEDEFRPYVTTSSMAVRRTVLEVLGGFREARSGADADLCWRAQLEGLGRVEFAPDSVTVCEPRSHVRDIWRQWRRYAVSYVELRSHFLEAGAAYRSPASVTRRLRTVLLDVGARRRRDVALEAVDAVRWIGYEAAYRAALRRHRGRRP